MEVHNMQQPKDWSRAQIKCALDNKGYTVKSLSAALGFKHNSVSVALTKPWAKVERIIADIIGVEPSIIWPSRYGKLITNPCIHNNRKSSELQVKSDGRNIHGLNNIQKVA